MPPKLKRTAKSDKHTGTRTAKALPTTAQIDDEESLGEIHLDPAQTLDREGIRLGFLIHDVSRMRRSAYDQFMKPLGITRAQWWVLAHLSRHDGMMQTRLAEVLEVGKASLGDVLESLESDGWIQRKPDPSDKRAKRVYLSRPSQSLIKRMTTMELEFNTLTLCDLSANERAALRDALLKIKNAVIRLASNAGANSLS